MLYRVAQGLHALVGWARPPDIALAESILNPQLLDLFRQMRRSEQKHSLRVLESVRVLGHSQSDLLVAALLHDAGKSRAPIGLLGRTVAVLGKGLVPTAARRWSEGKAQGWRKPFVVARQHPAWGADMLAEAGAPALAMRLVRRHQDKLEGDPDREEDRLLSILQAADSAN